MINFVNFLLLLTIDTNYEKKSLRILKQLLKNSHKRSQFFVHVFNSESSRLMSVEPWERRLRNVEGSFD